jgi:hypothetical protein
MHEYASVKRRTPFKDRTTGQQGNQVESRAKPQATSVQVDHLHAGFRTEKAELCQGRQGLNSEKCEGAFQFAANATQES